MPAGKGIRFQTMTNGLKDSINEIQKIGQNVGQIRETVKAVNGNWRKFSSTDSQKGLKEFINAIDRSPAKESLSQYDEKNLRAMITGGEMEIYQLGDNDIWFGLKKTKSGRDLVSVVNNTGIPGMLNVIMSRALDAGATTLDASSVNTPRTPKGLLPTLYERYGWKESERVKYDRQYLVEKKSGQTDQEHQELIDQKESALKMFWEEQGWDGKLMPDIVYMTHEGKQNGITIGKSEKSIFGQRVESARSATAGTTGTVRGSGLNEGSQQTTVGGTPPTTAGTDQGVLPRGIDPIVKTLRGASDVQIDAIGLTRKEVDKFLEKLNNLADPVTRDESGNVIPLSQRFNPTNSKNKTLAGQIRKLKE